MQAGTPASVWQLPETRALFSESDGVTVAGHQCQYEGVGRNKNHQAPGQYPQSFLLLLRGLAYIRRSRRLHRAAAKIMWPQSYPEHDWTKR